MGKSTTDVPHPRGQRVSKSHGSSDYQPFAHFVPPFLLPYAQLARMDKPGFLAVWITQLIGLFQAASIRGTPIIVVCQLGAYLGIVSQFIMWFNFAWNDTCDARFDRQVPRTRDRPLARGALTMFQALCFDSLLFGLTWIFLIPLPSTCATYAIPMTIGCLFYPLSKRITNYPQIVLGVVAQTGIFLGAATVGLDAAPYPVHWSQLLNPTLWYWPQTSEVNVLWASYLTGVLWNIFFEVIYSYQDAKWDAGAGVGTITRIVGDRRRAKYFLSFLALLQTACHLYVGSIHGFPSPGWLASVFATGLTLALQVWQVDLDSPEDCLHWFKIGILLTGSSMLFGYVVEYAVAMALA